MSSPSSSRIALPQRRVGGSRDVSPRSSNEFARERAGTASSGHGTSGGYLAANGGGSGMGGAGMGGAAESPTVPIPGGWPGGSGGAASTGGGGSGGSSGHGHEASRPPTSSSGDHAQRIPQPGVGAYGASTNSEGNWTRLPRITTSTPDANSSEDGPHSAPARPAPQFAISPLRSSSSPDPRASGPSSPSDGVPQSSIPRSGSSTAGLATSYGPPVLASPYYNPGQGASLQFPTPQLPAPPRRSSHLAISAGAPAPAPGVTSPTEAGQGSTSSHASNDGQAPPPTAAGEPSRPKERSERQGRSRGEPTYCGQCEQVVHGQFVRAMGKVYHLNCFRCKDCNKVVAQKFFPVEDGEGMYPLCERDYFARLDLICAKCDQALRSSYITACGEKYHVEHFTCSECDVVFGPNDSYYEHGSKVYCHFHYSTRFAVKCVGCETAILKQFVEMNRNGRDECWHPECYMISKFWNVRLASKTFSTPANSAVSSAVSLEMTPSHGAGAPALPAPSPLTPDELKQRQESMEMRVLQIWHVLSGYEESSAALIGEMLRAVNGRNLLDIVLLAERFILHVEALFAVIDDLEAQFSLAGTKGMSHAREAKQLCRKLVNLFSTMSQISPHQPQAQPTNQDLYNLITQLAHYLKILIRIALTGSIKLEREQGNSGAMLNTLARLNLLSMDGGDPTLEKRGDYPEIQQAGADTLEVRDGTATPASGSGDEEQLKRAIDALPRRPKGFLASTQQIAYGYRSLADEDFIPPEGCASCQLAIEEDCVRQGMFNRWHSPCVACTVCHDRAVPLQVDEADGAKHREDGSAIAPPKRPPPRVDNFVFELPSYEVYCVQHRTEQSHRGFEPVSRLEQYAFLLHIALRRLYVHFRVHHDLPSVRDQGLGDAYQQPDVKRVKSVVTLDRKLSSTARLPQRSMVVESPAGRIANEDGRIVSARSQHAKSTEDVRRTPEASPGPDLGADPEDTATVDVIRPPFARNNTSVLIINENNADLPPEIVEQLQTHQFMQEDDALTLGDIPLLADQSIHHRSPPSRPLLANLNHLQSLILKHFALLQLQKSGLGHLIDLDDVLELMDARKSQWWNKIFKGNAKDKQKKKGVFGVPLEILVERYGSDSQQGASNSTIRVPEFIEEIIATMRQMDMAIEGIFRKNGNIRRLQQISEALDKDSTNVNLSEENPVQLAALLKRFLRELPDPLLTFKLHKLFCAAASYQQVEERQRCLHLLICLLPRYNRDTMEVLFVFLKWVASFSYRDEETGSRMDIANLATVICPSILYAKGANAARDESFIANTAVQELLENQDEYFTVPSELLFVINENIFNIFQKDLDLPPKEIHRHCSKYMQARGPATRLQTSSSGLGVGMQGGRERTSPVGTQHPSQLPAPGQVPSGQDSYPQYQAGEANGATSPSHPAAQAYGHGAYSGGGHSHSYPHGHVQQPHGSHAHQHGYGHGHGQGLPAPGAGSAPHSPYRGTPVSSPTPPPHSASGPASASGHHAQPPHHIFGSGGAGGLGGGHPHAQAHAHALAQGSRPTSWLLATHGSQQSLQAVPSGQGLGAGAGSGWRGPMHVQPGGNGSRASSRGSAPGSPGPEGRASFAAEREREGRRTPQVQ